MTPDKTPRGTARRLRRAAKFHLVGCPCHCDAFRPRNQTCLCKELHEMEKLSAFFDTYCRDIVDMPFQQRT